MNYFRLTVLALLAVLASACATTGPQEDGVHKVVIQVSTDDPRTQTIALNNAVNLQKALGPGNVVVEIVAYGPGLSLLTRKSRQAKRVQGLALDEDLVFSACGNTMQKVKRKKGRAPRLIDGVRVVPSGVVRIMELQEQGYAYIRP